MISLNDKIVDEGFGESGLRDFGQICSLCQTFALMSGYDSVNEECIKHIAELFTLSLIPKKFFMLDEKVPFYHNCTEENVEQHS